MSLADPRLAERSRQTLSFLREPARLGDGWYWPPGWSEVDSPVGLLEAETVTLHDPDSHCRLDTFDDVEALGGLIGQPSEGRALARDVDPGDGGVDRLAWYVTFRSNRPWGIFIREHGIERVARAIAAHEGPRTADDRRVAFIVLYLHEYAHFLFDVAARSLEDVVGAPLYEMNRAAAVRTPRGWDPTNEAVCNAFAYRTVRAPGRKRRLKAFLRAAPEGYREFVNYLSDDDFADGIEAVLGSLLRGPGGRPGLGLRPLFMDRPGVVGPWLVPVALVPEPSAGALYQLITALAGLQTSKAFDRDLGKLPREVQTAWTQETLPALLSDVRRTSFKALRGRDNQYSARVAGKYRVLIERDKSSASWHAIRIDHRRSAYRE